MLVKILKFLTSTSIFLALNGLLVVVFGDFLYGFELNPELLLAAFLAVFSSYNLNKATDKVEDSINRPETVLKASVYYVGSAIAAMILSFGIGLWINPFAFLTLITPIVVGVVYSVKLSRSLPRLKEIVGAKSVSVAFSWALSGSLLPLSLHQAEFEKTALIFTYVFVQLLVNTILFDSLDAKGDSDSGIKTLPIVLGRSTTAKLLTIANSALCIWLAYIVFRGLFLNYLPALIFGVAYGYVLIWVFSSKGRQRLHAELMVDGEWLPIVVFMKIVIR